MMLSLQLTLVVWMSHKFGHPWNRYYGCWILLHWTHRVIVYSLNSIFESNLDIQDATDGTGIFKTLRIESQQKNQIGFEIDLSLLERALKSCEPAEMASLKLSKKQSAAFLCFEIIIQVSTFELWNSSTRDKLLLEQSVPMMTIIQDVPVKVLTGDEVYFSTSCGA